MAKGNKCKRLYTKNVLREKRVQTSPIHIDRELSSREELPKEDYHTNEDILTGIDLHEDALSPLETMEDAYEVNDNMKFASDIVERMEEEIKPSNIELTDYERKQEEEAIISYDELLKVKDKIYNITDEEKTQLVKVCICCICNSINKLCCILYKETGKRRKCWRKYWK